LRGKTGAMGTSTITIPEPVDGGVREAIAHVPSYDATKRAMLVLNFTDCSS
jgi:hypothetical protein